LWKGENVRTDGYQFELWRIIIASKDQRLEVERLLLMKLVKRKEESEDAKLQCVLHLF
jgi:hypothetical protein